MIEPTADVFAPVLSPLASVPGVFYRPTRVFESVSRQPSWWMPFLLTMILFYPVYFRVIRPFNVHQMMESALQRQSQQPKQSGYLSPAQRSQGEKMLVALQKTSWFAFPAIILLSTAIEAAVTLAITTFAFGGQARFHQVYSVIWYARVPGMIRYLPIFAWILISHEPMSVKFRVFDFANLAYYLNPATTPKILYSLASIIDPFTIWTLFLIGIGLAVIANIQRSRGMITALFWWIGSWVNYVFLAIAVVMILALIYPM